MKYRVIAKDWKFEVEGVALFPDEPECGIEWIRPNYSEGITVSLNSIPARIDLDDNGDIWLHNHTNVKYHKDPYSSSRSGLSKIIFTHPELSLVKKEG